MNLFRKKKWMELEIILLNEIRLIEKGKCFMFFIYVEIIWVFMCVYDIKDKGRLGGEVGLGRVGEARREYWWIDVVKVYVVE